MENILQEKEYSSSLIQTKLNRPPLPLDLVPRPRLIQCLELSRNRPLVLVSAPAGYGKSTLITCWAESVDRPVAWLSLDERDNDLGSFLSYFLAATNSIFPAAVPETQALLMVTPLPPVSAISKILINEFNQIEKPFILILDDYHIINNHSIHELLNELLLHPPRNMQMVLGTREDSSLPLVVLRAKGKVTEIRIQDLRFTQEETHEFLQKLFDTRFDWDDIAEIDAHAEGWVTGLRLAALAMQHRFGRDPVKGEISIVNRYITEYLLDEILAKQEPKLSDWMLRTSILDRFCVDLCETVSDRDLNDISVRSEEPEFNGKQFLEWLLASNLFVIPLDDQTKWFRYHHLFREFLEQELARKYSSVKIKNLHAAAGYWCANHDLIEEALIHLLTAGDTAAAIDLVSAHRHRMMNANRWPRMERWLNLFSKEQIEKSPELWMLKTWLVYHHGLWSQLPAHLDQLIVIVNNHHDQLKANNMVGEIYSLQSLVAYHSGDIKGAISKARQALVNLPEDFWIVRVMARTYLSISLLLSGDASSGYHSIYDTFQEEKVQSKYFTATLLMTGCYFHWISADLHSAEQAARQSIEICPETGYQSILGYGKYNLGRVHYQRNELSAAEELFTSIVARPYQNFGECYTSSACGLVMTCQAQGKAEKARQVCDETIAFLLETGNTTQLPFALALQAELDLMQGRLPSASQWADKLDQAPPIVPMAGFIAPILTLIKVWLAENSLFSQNKAANLLHEIRENLAGIHHTRLLIETLALQAMWLDAVGDKNAAIDTLEESLKLAQPGGFVRLFVDLGPQMQVLLSRLDVGQELHRYIKQIQLAFMKAHGCVPALILDDLPKTLTNREIEILELLSERLTNKEIADQLVIAPGTVKAHTIRIYRKLAVNSRREAVQRAILLGILQPI